jgi:hypothetical protein
MDYLVDWALSDRKDRIWGIHNLHYLMGLDLLGAHTPNENSITFACAYWKQVYALGPADRTRLQAIGRLLTRQHDGFPICARLSESQARSAFLDGEDRSLELWQQLYDLLPAWGETLRGDAAYRAGTVASDQYELAVVLAKVNSSKSLALLREIGKTNASPWLQGNVQNLLYNLQEYPASIMEDPAFADKGSTDPTTPPTVPEPARERAVPVR